MAYNLESLVRILEQILQPDQQRWNIRHRKRPQIESLLEKASSLKQILETCSPATDRGTESLESQIRDAAHKAEDIIESHMVDRMLSKPGGKSFKISPPDLQQVIQELDSAMDKMKKIVDEDQTPNTSLPGGVSLTPDPSSKDVVVGLDEDILRLKDRLTGDQSKLEIIPIVGMGGIGKTTLARNLYNDKLIVTHFDTCAWITVSQDYNVRAILLGLLGCIIGKLPDEMLQEKNNQLAVRLHKSLHGRRYLIVLDDIWSTNAWDDIKMFFPKDNSGSRIILTTRESDVAKYVESSSPQHQMHLLNKSESWNLLQQKVFGKENCPAELERIGKNIASSCGGLPLAIHVIGGLLSKEKRTTDSWEHVAYDIRTAIDEKGEPFFNVLSLSYKHLPNHLKPCFLYMAVFPEDYEIRASKLIRLWVAEGFLKSKGGKSLEEEAEDYLNALADRNLIVVTKRKSNGKAKSYSIHDLLRELCIRKDDEEKFLYVSSRRFHNLPLRRVSVHPSSCIYVAEEFILLARSFLCIGRASRAILTPVFSELRLLRVLDVFHIEFHQFPTEILQLVNLRYLAFSCNSFLPSAISRLWNLQTLIVWSRLNWSDMPSEIWEMPELRHIKFIGAMVHIESDYRKDFVQEKLQTISQYMSLNQLLESNVLGCIPNIKKLGIRSLSSPTSVVDLYLLHKLETLKCLSDLSCTFLSALRFPPSLRKLTLDECIIPWRFMTTVASLPNLEVLKIRKCAFEGQEAQPEDEQEWEATEEEFCSLQFLLLENLNLVHWRADKTNFPRLRHLVIRGCSALKEIPNDIGEIPTLELIEVDESSPSVVDSARQIQAEQHEYGNDDIEIRKTVSCRVVPLLFDLRRILKVLEEARKHKRETKSRSIDLHFKLQKPISKDDSSKKIKKNKKRWWRDALLFFKFPKWASHGGAAADLGGRHHRIGSISGPIYITESRGGSSTPYRTASRPGSRPIMKGEVEIPYISLRELNMDQDHRISSPIYLVT